jgi:hypothetical protein
MITGVNGTLMARPAWTDLYELDTRKPPTGTTHGEHRNIVEGNGEKGSEAGHRPIRPQP